MDGLVYNYENSENSNRLDAVFDVGPTTGFWDHSPYINEYDYDDNGNIIKDNNKQISYITYNYLNHS